MDDSSIYQEATSDALWMFNLSEMPAPCDAEGRRPCTPSPAAYKTLSSDELFLPSHMATFGESDRDFLRKMDLACSAGMSPTFDLFPGSGEFSVQRVISYTGRDGDIGCRFWEIVPGCSWEASFMRWEGKTAVACFPRDEFRRTIAPPCFGFYRFHDLMLREDIAEKFAARNWPGIQLDPVKLVHPPHRAAMRRTVVFKANYFRLSVSRAMPRRHGKIDYLMDDTTEESPGEERSPTVSVLHCNLNGLIDNPRVFDTDVMPGSDLACSRECDFQYEGYQSHRLFVSAEFKAWAKAEGIPFDYANAFFLDSFENLTATEYISRLKIGGPLW